MRSNIVEKLNKDELKTLLYFVNITKASLSNIVKFTVLSLLLGTLYFYNIPRFYEASITIKPAMVRGLSVESPEMMMEKINLKLYSTTMTCNKYKYTIHKELNSLTILSQEESVQKAKACLEAELTGISSVQNELAKTLVEKNKQKIRLLKEELDDVNQHYKLILRILNDSKKNDKAFLNLIQETKENNRIYLKESIFKIESELDKQDSQPLVNLRGQIDVNDQSVNKGPMFFLVLSLISGVIVGFVFTIIKNLVAQIYK